MGALAYEDLRDEYNRLYSEADIPDGRQEVVSESAQKIIAHWDRYQTVASSLNIPPHPIALIHALESGCNFNTHLHNGDPLTARTVHEPKNRPATGEPPFTWEASAMDALRSHGLDKWLDWSIAGLCYVLERYNGWGYRKYHPNVKSPYLWSFTSIYTTGKYVADGKWSETAISQQVGAMALLIELNRQGKTFPVAQEVADVPSVEDVAPAQAESLKPGVQTGAVMRLEDGPEVDEKVGASVPGNGALTVGGITLSKKLCALIGGVLLLLFGPALGLHLAPEQQKSITDALMAYLVAQGAADFGAPLVALLRKYTETPHA